MSEQYGAPLKYFNLLGASDLRAGRAIITLIAISAVFAVVIAVLVGMNRELQETNRRLQSERIMYGFPNSEGIFISERQIPQRHIIAFVAVFLDNYYNFTPLSARTNAEEALRMMSPRLRALKEDSLKIVANQSVEQQITQVFTKSSPYQVEVTPQGYVVSFTAERHRATLNRVFNKAKYNVKILIKPVKPSKFYEWAVVADDFDIQEI
ncbi:hypothetical protein OFL75_34405 [Pseudomonas aeruginosa]|jgi:hypothetical protein|uniref:Uncharacterized protein n=7 Tax=Pseudomonas TaxID=286 RepID=A0A1V0M6N3_PSEAI|nr:MULTISPECIES: hypothetical protein [Pseudomonas]AVX92790.1 hypothetical protein PkP19E3_32105 [Pseudomonas koreensis]EQL44036.1 hypothetical protein M770_30175 [Pseudomonas aeruginosa VRFPA03]MCP8472936.1 hypothetical protein [Pseudomonas triclosanedens]MCP8479506.1 hypothetical protein [Pseudomonas triclosanedens]WQN30377.1 hypothetical protein ULE26_22665 [Stutzerimonas stutzeri]